MNEQTQTMDDWRNDIIEPKNTMKIADTQTVHFTFKNEGTKKSHTDFGNSIAFEVLEKSETENRIWYVSSTNYDLLNQVKALGQLTGLYVKVNRTGSKKSDTRYFIEKAVKEE